MCNVLFLTLSKVLEYGKGDVRFAFTHLYTFESVFSKIDLNEYV